MKKIELLLLLFLILGCSYLSNAQQLVELVEGNKVRGTNQIRGKDQYQIPMEKGQFALINVEQQGIDVKIITYDANGKKLEEFDSPNGAFGSELTIIDGRETGKYIVEVIPLSEEKKKTGAYTIELTALSKNLRSHLDKSFELIGSSNNLPGFFISIVDNEKVLYTHSQGFANIKKQIPYDINTIQQIESISKTFLGLSLMLLVEEGKLDLDTDINAYLPFKVVNPYFPKSPITLRHLATHTGTINDREIHEKLSWIENKEIFHQNRDKYIHKERRKFYQGILNNEEIAMEDFLKSFFLPKEKNYSKKNFLKNKPGEHWYYSNIGATLGAYIVELVSEQPYDEFVAQHIISPLKLENTTWGYNGEESSMNALKYGGGKNEYPRRTSATYPDGGLYMSAADLSSYLMELIKGYSGRSSLLKANSFQELMKVQFEEKNGQFKGIKNGLFWWIFNANRMGHNGGNMGSNANMFFYPDLGVGYTSFENMSYGESEGAMLQSDRIKQLLNRYIKYFNIE